MDELEIIKSFQEKLRDVPADQILEVAKVELAKIGDPHVREVLENFVLILATANTTSMATGNHVVVLIHGIRTYAVWEDVVEQIFRDELGVSVYQIRYEWFDLFNFWCPLFTRTGPISRVLRELRDIRKRHPVAPISVVCHSFGTYIISRILRDEPDITVSHVVFCGSVVKRAYEWASLPTQPSGKIVNDCGSRDYWPVVADRLSWGYGASGTFGFTSTRVINRFHDVSHGGYFNSDFIKQYWVTVLRDGTIANSPWQTQRPKPSFPLTMLANSPTKLLMNLGLLAIICYITVLIFRHLIH